MSYTAHNLTDTIVALATPPGVGALGVIRLSGKDAIQIADIIFFGKKLEKQASHTIHFGTIRNDKGRIIDEVLASLFVAPHSYTKENVVEFSCHGSNYIIQEIIQLCIQKGARMAQPGEFTLRAFLNGRMDLSQAEAVADLIASNSQSSHELAMKQLRGGISQEIKDLRQQLIDFASLIELELDFSEEDVEFADRDDLRALVQKIQKLIHSLIESFQLGNAIKQGVNTVIAGRPNAGKSTLLNALLNEERAIVSDIAGTTRDTIEEVLNIKGVHFRLIDTAGIREAQDAIEEVGVQKTMEKIEQSAILVYVFDVIQLSPEEVRADLSKLYREGMQLLIVANKMDLNPYTKFEQYFSKGEGRGTKGGEKDEGRGAKDEGVEGQGQGFLPSEDSWVPISALNQMNIEYLKDKLYQSVISQQVSMDDAVVSNIRHYEALQKAYDSLTAVLQGMDMGVTSDFVAMDIRQALHYLGEITGEISTDDLLGNIFANFCIGK
jgi:tRNA modification GTPase